MTLFWRNSKGQGTVEYILLVVVIIMMATIIGLRLFKPFNEWASHYIGMYVECLLDYGELPSLGGEEAFSDGECDKQFKPFDVGEGRAPREQNNNQSQLSGPRRAGSGTASYRASGGRSRTALGVGFDQGGGDRAGVTQVGADERLTGNSRSPSYSFPNSNSTRRQPSQEVSYGGIRGIIEREREKIKRREERVRTVSRDTASVEAQRRLNKFPADPNPQKKPKPDLDLGGFDLGGLIRIILIVFIVIALALFLAGQLAQISKSLEKN